MNRLLVTVRAAGGSTGTWVVEADAVALTERLHDLLERGKLRGWNIRRLDVDETEALDTYLAYIEQ